jgi:hypothetical protein
MPVWAKPLRNPEPIVASSSITSARIGYAKKALPETSANRFT